LRRLGFDFAKMTGSNLVVSSPSGLISSVTGGSITTSGNPTFLFNVGNAGSAFFGVMDALRQDGLSKVLAEPNLVAISGRPAYFLEGGEFGYQLNGGITGPTVQFKDYGTRVDFVPIVMGNGRIRLEVRPSVSEIDASLSVGGIPALKVREAETGVEMKAGQTLAIAGLVQQVTDSSNAGLPWISELPYVGTPFRHVQEQTNEVELLIMVTPELVDALDASQVPPCGPGMETASPSDWELFFKGHLEVPVCCNKGSGGNCNSCPAGGPAPQPGEPIPAPAPAQQGGANYPYNQYTRPQPNNSAAVSPREAPVAEPPFIGPIGYDVAK
jgi:pilus assembly protein CpaC